MTTITYPPELPIVQRRDELLGAITDHQVVVVAGETGSGKSTQLPKFCLELGRGTDGFIGHTQPRRIAARSIAERVAGELGSAVGNLVGYAVRFTDQIGEQTRVKLMTDGILLAEIQRDRRLEAYDTLIIDEAHERSLNIDFLLGYLHRLLPERPDLKLLITSATIDTERFAAHFGGAPVIEVSGRTHPVETRYRPPGPGTDQPAAICDAVRELWSEGSGDVLAFCSGEREIRDAAEALEDLRLPDVEVVPLFARLSFGDQQRVFAPHDGRRVVLATNIAETSLTVPGIRYVVDPGRARISRYGARSKVQRLPIEPVSRASADQRAGRCGRVAPGICIRLYSEEDYDGRPEFTEPEVRRTSLASVILQMAALGLGDVEAFPFVDPPDSRQVRDGIALLEELGALDPDAVDTDGVDTGRRLTPIGRRLARLPVDPRLGRMILEADRYGCLHEVMVIAAGMSIQDPRERPVDDATAADEMHERFRTEGSDFVGFLRLWDYVHGERRTRTSNQFRRMCRREHLNYVRLREWQDIYGQLRRVAMELKLRRNREPAEPDAIHRALLAGLLSHVGRRMGDRHEYEGARGTRFALAPGSTLFAASPRWVMAGEIVETTRLWARVATRIRPEWAEEAGSHVVRRRYDEPWWDGERAMTTERVTLYGLPLVEGRRIGYRRVDRDEARAMFIDHALVDDDWNRSYPFVDHNRRVLDELDELRARTRRGDLIADRATLFDFFDAHIPADVATTRDFDSWWGRIDDPHVLDLDLGLLLGSADAEIDHHAFPEVWHHGDVDLSLSYEFDPTSRRDGVTVQVPVGALADLDAGAFEWNVPGLRGELVEALIRSLPKRLRTRFVPVPDTAAAITGRLDEGSGSLLEALRAELGRLAGTPIPIDAFDLDRLPHHLRPTFAVTGEDGSVLAEGDDLRRLRAELGDVVRSALAGHPIETGVERRWAFGDIPRRLALDAAGGSVTGYPALVDAGDGVALRVLPSALEQADAMWLGTRRLLRFSVAVPARALAALLTNRTTLALAAGPYDGRADWIEDCVACALDQVMIDNGAPVWSDSEYDALATAARRDLTAGAEAIGRRSLDLLATAADLRERIDGLPQPRFELAAGDAREHLHRLVYAGFLSAVGADRLPDVDRYLRALAHRLDRLPDSPRRDTDATVQCRRIEAEYRRLTDLVAWSVGLEDLAWMIEEHRVSRFAQSVGVKGQVSAKRIRAAMARLTQPVPA